LTIITVREPTKLFFSFGKRKEKFDQKKRKILREVLKKLRRILGNWLNIRYHGHYQWLMMGVEVHLVVINQLPVTREYYAWLSFAEGAKYQQYQENLVKEIQRDEGFQVYLDLLKELEEEGKARMAYEVLKRMIIEMPSEKQMAILREILERLPKEHLQEILKDLSAKNPPETREQRSIADS
jgi:hypothetical protein